MRSVALSDTGAYWELTHKGVPMRSSALRDRVFIWSSFIKRGALMRSSAIRDEDNYWELTHSGAPMMGSALRYL
jgi:hypothetical protein